MLSSARLKLLRSSKQGRVAVQPELFQHQLLSSKDNSGFTLIEVVVVVLIIGILSAIAAPGWFGFIQQRRVGTVNDAVFRALQEAQSQAKKTKLSQSVSFRMKDGFPQIASYATKAADDSLNKPDNSWQNLGKELQLKKDQVLLCSNLAQTNASRNNTSQVAAISCDLENKERTIVFDHEGNLESGANLGSDGLIVSVAVPKPNQPTQALAGGVRCVKVITLIGSMQIGRGKYDETNNKQGCPLP